MSIEGLHKNVVIPPFDSFAPFLGCNLMMLSGNDVLIQAPCCRNKIQLTFFLALLIADALQHE